PLAGRTLVAHAMGRAESVCGRHSVLVVGNEWRNVAAACRNTQGFLVVNTAYREGLSTSIRAGVASLAGVADAVLLMLADQPLVTADHLQTLVGKWRESPASIVASAYADAHGPPVIFPRRCFSALQSLRGDRGAKSVIDAAVDRVITVECAAAALDVDRPEDLENI
ncbi:MAG: nucleotidyltransferase family protein, partial [Gammaproteobacteria bacterium]|nr:nucleotidyltransferase family protein [Gammaproteobacteria bacterium]